MKHLYTGVYVPFMVVALILANVPQSTMTISSVTEISEFPSVSSSATTLYVSPNTLAVSVGEIFSINISVGNVIDLYSFNLYLWYDPELLDALYVSVYFPFNTGPSTPPIIGDGYIAVSGTIGLPGYPGQWGSFPIVKVAFNATAAGNSILHFSNTELLDSMSRPIAHTCVDGSVEILDPNIQCHDIAVVSILPLKTVVGQGCMVNVNITVVNRGSFSETFNLSFYANLTETETKLIDLPSGASKTLTFTWSLTNCQRGSYVIWAYAWPVEGETDISDNTSAYYVITVTVLGDLDGDFDVDLSDLVIMARHYGHEPPDGHAPETLDYFECLNSDIDSNGVVDLSDLVMLARNYGKQYP